MPSELIEFTTGCQKRQVRCYLKEHGYDVYIDGLLIKQNASVEWCVVLKVLLS